MKVCLPAPSTWCRRSRERDRYMITIRDWFSTIFVSLAVVRSALGVRRTFLRSTAHPSSVSVSESKVVSYIEDLVDNVLGKHEVK